jgi:hypothetical protein
MWALAGGPWLFFLGVYFLLFFRVSIGVSKTPFGIPVWPILGAWSVALPAAAQLWKGWRSHRRGRPRTGLLVEPEDKLVLFLAAINLGIGAVVAYLVSIS